MKAHGPTSTSGVPRIPHWTLCAAARVAAPQRRQGERKRTAEERRLWVIGRATHAWGSLSAVTLRLIPAVFALPEDPASTSRKNEDTRCHGGGHWSCPHSDHSGKVDRTSQPVARDPRRQVDDRARATERIELASSTGQPLWRLGEHASQECIVCERNVDLSPLRRPATVGSEQRERTSGVSRRKAQVDSDPAAA